MSWITRLMQQQRLVLAIALLLCASGLAAWQTMPREEDPQFPKRFANVIVQLPGADALTVERLVVEPIERHLAQVSELRRSDVDVRSGLAAFQLQLKDTIYETDDAWDVVQDAMDAARTELPATASPPRVSDDASDNESIVFALRGSDDPIVLAEAAVRVRKDLLRINGVARIELAGDPAEQVVIELSPSALSSLHVSAAQVAAQLKQGYDIAPQGLVALAGKTAVIKAAMTFNSLADVRCAPITLPTGDIVPLESIASVTLQPRAPAIERARWNGEAAIGIGLVAERDIDMVAYGKRVRAEVERLRSGLAPLELREVAFQPDFVSQRLSGLATSLFMGVLVVAAVLMFAMGIRLGAVVASVVPVVALSAVGLFATGGGALHQMSIAALVLALGLLVDNAIVVAEGVQQGLDEGLSATQAAVNATRDLVWPLGASTGTTVAAFVPMLTSSGATADFTRAIPIVIMLTLVLSYIAAVTVTPMLAAAWLKPNPQKQDAPAWIQAIARVASARPGPVVLVALLAVAGAVVLAPRLRSEFFPTSDRQMVIVDVELPEGSHIDTTEAITARIEHALEQRGEIGSVFATVGRGLPRLYYNLVGTSYRPHVAQLAIQPKAGASIDALVQHIRGKVAPTMPEARIVARRLEQGPPVRAPVEIRLYADNLDALYEASERVAARLRQLPTAADVRHDMSPGAPVIALDVHDASLAAASVSRVALTNNLAGQTLGFHAGTYWMRDEGTPIMVRASSGDRLPLRQLGSLPVSTQNLGATPLVGEVAVQRVEWQPAALTHRNGRRVARITAQLQPGASFSSILAALKPDLDTLAGKTEWELGGLAEGSGEANASLLTALPLGIALLLAFLLAEFNSFRRTLIILVTVPLSAVGVVPGLLLANQPFGFMSMLGAIALIGIVVNNAIVLIDVLDQQLRAHGDMTRAIRYALERRIRPVLLTTVTTTAGLLPLAISDSPLWPPLAWAMISGLVASTALTLLVVPALYKLMLTPRVPSMGFASEMNHG